MLFQANQVNATIVIYRMEGVNTTYTCGSQTYRVIAMVHTIWINQTGRYDTTLTHFPFFLLSSVSLSISSICCFVSLLSGLLHMCPLVDFVLVASSIPVFYSLFSEVIIFIFCSVLLCPCLSTPCCHFSFPLCAFSVWGL